MAKYKAILFAPDGEWVTYFDNSDSVEEVMDKLSNMGSTWFFYPFHAVIRDKGGWTDANQRIISAAEPFEYLIGRNIRTFSKEIADTPNEQLKSLLQ